MSGQGYDATRPPRDLKRPPQSSPSLSNSEVDNVEHQRAERYSYERDPPQNASKEYLKDTKELGYREGKQQNMPYRSTGKDITAEKQHSSQQWIIRRRNDGQSQFRSHFLFENLNIPKGKEEQFINLFIPFLTMEVGTITFLDKLRQQSNGQTSDRLTISIGLRSDLEAVKYLDNIHNQLPFQFNESTLILRPIVSNGFKFYFPEAKRLMKEENDKEERRKLDQERKRLQREKAELERQRQRERLRQKERERYREKERERNRDRQRRKSRSPERERKNGSDRKIERDRKHSKSKSRSRERAYYKRSPSRESHSQSRYKKNDITLRVFGIPKEYSQKDVLLKLKQDPEGPFNPLDWGWESVGSTSCFRIVLSERRAEQLLRRAKNGQVNWQLLPVIIECHRSESSIREALARHQVRITYPRPVCPSNLYTALSELGRVVQMTSQDRQNRSFIITFSSSRSAKSIKGLVLDSNVRVEALSTGQLVYRPSHYTTLRELMKGRRPRDHPGERS